MTRRSHQTDALCKEKQQQHGVHCLECSMENRHENAENIRVYLRLRPLNRFEENRRSRTVVEVIEEKRIAVEDPDQGEWEAEFDGVFEPSCSQQQVFAESCRRIPLQLLQGFNYSVVAYGATGTGKTHTLIGDSDADGLVSRLATDLFDSIASSDPSVEFTVRCSVVEVYLERLRDLLNESSHVQLQPNGRVVGCTRLSCLTARDVSAVVQRAVGVRTCSAADPNRDSSRSSLIVQVELEQYDHRLDRSMISMLRMCDLLGCELSAISPVTGEETSEPVMVSQSLQYLHRQIKENREGVPVSAPESAPMIARMISNCIGGNSYASVILTASPSNYAVRETVNTLRFGLDCRDIVNKPFASIHERWQDANNKIQSYRDRQTRYEDLTKALAQECRRLQAATGCRVTKSLEQIVDNVLECDVQDRDLAFRVETPFEHQTKNEHMRLRSEARRAVQERKDAQSEATQLRSDLAILQSQNASLRDHLSKVQEELAATKNETLVLQQRKQEVEHNLRTSLFRESEAIVFLRQLRRFYYRLLKNMAAEGSGDMEHNICKIPGAPDLTQLVDIDQAMMESGLLEPEEVGADVSTTYRPSRSALLRSTSASEDAAVRASEEEAATPTPNGSGTAIVVSDAPPLPRSVVKREEGPRTVEARQRLYSTPSGRYVSMREDFLEEELLALSERCIQLQNQLQDEQANVEALTGRTGVVGAFDRMRAASETRLLKDQLVQKENDLKAVIWKMNELHLAGKTLRAESTNKDHHIAYLEENLDNLQNKNTFLASEKEEGERKLREESRMLQDQLERTTVPVWNLSNTSAIEAPFQCRLVVPFKPTGGSREAPERRESLSEKGEWMDLNLLDQSNVERMDTGTQTDGEPFSDSSVVPAEIKPTPAENFLFMDDSSGTDWDQLPIRESSIPSRQVGLPPRQPGSMVRGGSLRSMNEPVSRLSDNRSLATKQSLGGGSMHSYVSSSLEDRFFLSMDSAAPAAKEGVLASTTSSGSLVSGEKTGAIADIQAAETKQNLIQANGVHAGPGVTNLPAAVDGATEAKLSDVQFDQKSSVATASEGQVSGVTNQMGSELIADGVPVSPAEKDPNELEKSNASGPSESPPDHASSVATIAVGTAEEVATSTAPLSACGTDPFESKQSDILGPADSSADQKSAAATANHVGVGVMAESIGTQTSPSSAAALSMTADDAVAPKTPDAQAPADVAGSEVAAVVNQFGSRATDGSQVPLSDSAKETGEQPYVVGSADSSVDQQAPAVTTNQAAAVTALASTSAAENEPVDSKISDSTDQADAVADQKPLVVTESDSPLGSPTTPAPLSDSGQDPVVVNSDAAGSIGDQKSAESQVAAAVNRLGSQGTPAPPSDSVTDPNVQSDAPGSVDSSLNQKAPAPTESRVAAAARLFGARTAGPSVTPAASAGNDPVESEQVEVAGPVDSAVDQKPLATQSRVGAAAQLFGSRVTASGAPSSTGSNHSAESGPIDATEPGVSSTDPKPSVATESRVAAAAKLFGSNAATTVAPASTPGNDTVESTPSTVPKGENQPSVLKRFGAGSPFSVAGKFGSKSPAAENTPVTEGDSGTQNSSNVSNDEKDPAESKTESPDPQETSSKQLDSVDESADASASAPAPAPKLSTFMERLQKKAKKQSSDDKSTTPEFLKLFQKIGGRNHEENVIEASGHAPVVENTMPSSKPWTPRKKKSDDDSSSSSSGGGVGGYAPSQPTYNFGGDDSSSSSEDETEATSPAATPADDNKDSDSEPEAEPEPEPAKEPEPEPAPPTPPPARKNTYDSDSDASSSDTEPDSSDSDSAPPKKPAPPPVATPAPAPAPPPAPTPPPQPASSYNPPTKKTSYGSDSDSDSSDSEPDSPKKPAPVAAPRPPPPPKKLDSDSDSSDSEPDSPKKPAPVAAPRPTPPPKKLDSDSDSSDSEPDSPKKPAPAPAPRPALSRPTPDSDSDSDSSDDGPPARKSAPAPPAKKDSDSESDSSDSEPDSPKKPAPPPVTRKAADSDSDSDSSDAEVPAKKPVPPPKPATKDSDSESDSSDSEPDSPKKPAPQKTAARSAPDSDSDSDESSSEEESARKPPAMKPPVPKPGLNSEAESSDDETNVSESEAPATSARDEGSSSEEESGSEESSSEEESITKGGKPVDFSPKRGVPDFGSKATPAVSPKKPPPGKSGKPKRPPSGKPPKPSSGKSRPSSSSGKKPPPSKGKRPSGSGDSVVSSRTNKSSSTSRTGKSVSSSRTSKSGASSRTSKSGASSRSGRGGSGSGSVRSGKPGSRSSSKKPGDDKSTSASSGRRPKKKPPTSGNKSGGEDPTKRKKKPPSK